MADEDCKSRLPTNKPAATTSEVASGMDDEDSQGKNSNDSDRDENDVTKEMKMLSFVNPGKFMENFHPETSAREMRKLNRRIYRENGNRLKNQLYDEIGVLLDNGRDWCDCLDTECPGCHYPCQKCGSEKCGYECRCARKWIFEQIEVEGTSNIIKWPN